MSSLEFNGVVSTSNEIIIPFVKNQKLKKEKEIFKNCIETLKHFEKEVDNIKKIIEGRGKFLKNEKKGK
jgi:flagellar motility protein MotE (MotC chaperone)